MASQAGGNAEQPDPRARLMQEVADEMDGIEAEFGDDYQIGRVITVVEVIKQGGDGEPTAVGLRVRAGQYPWVALGMLEAAKKNVEARLPPPE